jgi:hypothetical protein
MIYVLKNEPSPGAFCDLLDYGVDQCAYAVMVIRPLSRMTPRGEEVLKILEPYLIEKKVSNQRPGTSNLAENALVQKYKYGVPFSGLIRKLNDRLYGWLQPNFPEDICLLRENQEPWFVSAAHKKDSFFSLAEGELSGLIRKVPEMGRILKKDDGAHGRNEG